MEHKTNMEVAIALIIVILKDNGVDDEVIEKIKKAVYDNDIYTAI